MRPASASRLFSAAKFITAPRRQISAEAIAAIQRLAEENPAWGAKRIVGELEKLSIRVCKRTVQRILGQVRPRGRPGSGAGQSWATFVRNHLDVTWACDFFTLPVGLCSQLHVFFVMEAWSRHLPTTRQQLHRAGDDEGGGA